MSETLSIKSRLRNYRVNLIDEFTETIMQKNNKDYFILLDKKLTELYKEQTHDILSKFHSVLIEATETNKTLDYCQTIIKNLIGMNIRKNSTLITIGGGIIQDISAFISSILFRGINWTFYPTTLLAQADSCIGSKTSLNLGEFKNLLGTFYPPSDIFIDVKFLKTLSMDEIKSGIGEILHFYFIAGNGLLKRLVNNYDKLLTSPVNLKDYILGSLKIKKRVIEIDEFDKNERNLFNYGHTFGHAIETISGYKINHGQAVTMGMDIANYISLNLGYLNKNDFESMHKILAINMPSFQLQEDKIGHYFKALSKDKKNIGNNLGCILSSGPGAMKKVQIPLDDKLMNIILSYFGSFA